MKRNKEEVERNERQVPLAVFLESYNSNIPESFPRASVAILKKFQSLHPMLFRHGDTWSIDRHRKKVMDWFSEHRNIA